MTSLPIPGMWSMGHFIPLASHRRYVAERYGDGEVVTLAAVEERSTASHNHFFSVVQAAFDNLPEHLAERFASPDHLRRWCLVKAGWRDERTTVAATSDEALRIAAFVRPMDDYAIVVVSDCTVIVWTAKSQSMQAMGREDFNTSKSDVLRVLSELIGVDVTELRKAA